MLSELELERPGCQATPAGESDPDLGTGPALRIPSKQGSRAQLGPGDSGERSLISREFCFVPGPSGSRWQTGHQWPFRAEDSCKHSNAALS